MKAIAAAGGVGGVLAALMFWFYRADSLSHQKRQDEFIEMQASSNRTLLEVVRGNTAAVVSLQASTEALRGTVTALDQNAQRRDNWFKDHIAPIFNRMGRQ